jgi:hypothetical protein
VALHIDRLDLAGVVVVVDEFFVLVAGKILGGVNDVVGGHIYGHRTEKEGKEECDPAPGGFLSPGGVLCFSAFFGPGNIPRGVLAFIFCHG